MGIDNDASGVEASPTDSSAIPSTSMSVGAGRGSAAVPNPSSFVGGSIGTGPYSSKSKGRGASRKTPLSALAGEMLFRAGTAEALGPYGCGISDIVVLPAPPSTSQRVSRHSTGSDSRTSKLNTRTHSLTHSRTHSLTHSLRLTYQ